MQFSNFGFSTLNNFFMHFLHKPKRYFKLLQIRTWSQIFFAGTADQNPWQVIFGEIIWIRWWNSEFKNFNRPFQTDDRVLDVKLDLIFGNCILGNSSFSILLDKIRIGAALPRLFALKIWLYRLSKYAKILYLNGSDLFNGNTFWFY